MKPTQQHLQSILDYNPETGILTWKIRKQKIIIGSEAGTKRKDGYRRIKIDGKLYYSHSIALMIYYGKWYDLIDHDNQIRDDNRICNISPSNKVGNGQNCSISKANTSGATGVNFFKRDQKWQASLTFLKKTYHLGYFDKKEDAIEARKKGEQKFGFKKKYK